MLTNVYSYKHKKIIDKRNDIVYTENVKKRWKERDAMMAMIENEGDVPPG